jgi:hypothetical protein
LPNSDLFGLAAEIGQGIAGVFCAHEVLADEDAVDAVLPQANERVGIAEAAFADASYAAGHMLKDAEGVLDVYVKRGKVAVVDA